MGDVDVCVGFNDDWSRPDKALLDYAVNLFEDNGYSYGTDDVGLEFSLPFFQEKGRKKDPQSTKISYL